MNKWLLIVSTILSQSFFIDISLASWKTSRESLGNVYQTGVIRLFYSLKGKDALPEKNQIDANKNSIPDYIENIALRLQLASDLFEKSFVLTHPLNSLRYKGKAKTIDVHFLSGLSHGSTGDGIHHFIYKKLSVAKGGAISIKLSTSLRKGTFTPVHEMFHVFQNGYSMFKNRWYTEGIGRWSEYAQKKGTGSRKRLPKSVKELDDILQQTYKTKTFWRQLGYLLDSNNANSKGKFKLPSIAKNKVIGFPVVIEDNRLYGIHFMKTFLEQLDYFDDIASAKRGLDPFSWKEKKQKSASNNNYILCALQEAINLEYNGMKTIAEIEQFLIVLNQYTANQCEKLAEGNK